MTRGAFQSPVETPGPEVADALVETLEAVREGDMLVINERERTWLVTDITEEAFGTDDFRLSRQTITIESSEDTCRLVHDRYPGRHTAHIVPVEASLWLEQAVEAFALTDLRRLGVDITYVVVSAGQGRYHRPDPVAVADGAVAPLCRHSSPDEHQSRLVRREAVAATTHPCRDCFRQSSVETFGPAACPACDYTLGSAVLVGGAEAAVGTVSVTCPECAYDGVLADGAASPHPHSNDD